VDWDVVSFVLASELRFRVLLRLNSVEATPSRLAQDLDAPISHVSKALSELSSRKLIKLLTPNRKKARFYGIDDHGRAVLTEIHRVTGRKA